MMADVVRAAVQAMRPKPPKPEEPPPKNNSSAVRRVLLRQDTTVVFPQLYLSVYVHGTDYEARRFAEMFSRSGCFKAERPKDADLVIFAGSDDVSPVLYGEDADIHKMCGRFNVEEDMAGIKMFQHCRRHGIPMMGVCKGAQLLHVCMGGKLYQHVDEHYGDHPILDLRTRSIIEKVSSNHHQMVIPNKGMRVLASTNRANNKWKNGSENDKKVGIDVEAFWYERAGILGIQGHPEYRGYHYFAAWVLEQIDHFIQCNPIFELKDNYRRLKPEFVATRKEDPVLPSLTPLAPKKKNSSKEKK